MDYQIVPKTHNQHIVFVISLLIFSLLPYCVCIVNRDLVLTPKQGLQLSGKRIFYEESNNNDNKALNHNDTVGVTVTRPWERALKHVTYLTLFTNAANGIITGNFSKVREYNDFLTSAYMRSPKLIDTRFGDIVTLAEGRLESMPNGSYRFVEGNCDYECARESNIIAMWHIQKIRHRDTADRKYHYEMKFSVSPITAKAPTETLVRGGPNKRTTMEERQNNVQTFIQKEDDYPHSFRKIVSDKDEDFLERRYDAARNFRQVSAHYQKPQVTPIPQSTFLRGVYRHPPPQPSMQLQQHPNVAPQHTTHVYNHNQQNHHHRLEIPSQERLNIGEFYKGNYVPKSTSKIELFPNLLSMFMGKPPVPSTTFRPPSYQIKFPRPEIYALQQHQNQEFSKLSEYQQPALLQSQEQFNQRKSSQVPIVTHHYHHHYFMPNNSAITVEQTVQQSVEQNENPTAEFYHNEVTEVAAPQGYVTNLYEEPHTATLAKHHFPVLHQQIQGQYHPKIAAQSLNQNYHSNYHIQQIMPPAPQKLIFPNTQIEQQRVVHVTPAPTLRKPQYTQEQQYYDNHPFTSSLEYTTVHVPLLISYPAPINGEQRVDVTTARNKPFVHSDPMEDNIHYSEPDPLYANANEEGNKNENKFITNRQHQQHSDESQEPQLESPEHDDQSQKSQQQNIEEADNKKEHSESIEAQLPAPNENIFGSERAKNSEDNKEIVTEQYTSPATTTIQITKEVNAAKSIKTEASNSITAATKRTKIFNLRNKRISVQTGAITSSTSTTKKPTTLPTSSNKPITTTTLNNLPTASKLTKKIVSTSSTESPLRIISRYRNSYARTSSTSTTTTEKPVLKWTPKRKINNFMAIRNITPTETNNEGIEENNGEDEDFKTNESNNIRNAKSFNLSTTAGNFVSETTTKTPSNITSTSAEQQSPIPPPSPILSQTSQTETEIYEVLTQKSVSKSVSLKVGNNGEEIPVIIDDEENEVKKV